MSITRNLTALAAGIVAGKLTHDEVKEMLGDASLFSQVTLIANNMSVASAAKILADNILDNEVTQPIFDEVDDLVDDTFGDLFDF